MQLKIAKASPYTDMRGIILQNTIDYYKLYPTSTEPPKFYGVPNVHKQYLSP